MEIEKARDLFRDKVRNGSFLGLGRIEALMHELGDPQKDLRSIHIAGTNGKGSTAAMLGSVLKRAGYSVGLYTSPALAEFNERIRYNGENITDEEVAELIPEISAAAERVGEKGFETVSEFEFVTALGFLYFYKKRADIVVLETGLGGRLDATNVIPSPIAAVITAIGFDHMDRLGDTLEKIAAEKAAIIKPGCAAISYDQLPEAAKVINERCREIGAEAVFAQSGAIRMHSSSAKGQLFDYKERKDLFIPLAGIYQMSNAAVVLETVDALVKRGLVIPEKAVYEGLAGVSWCGRMQFLRYDPPVILDGAHNIHGVKALCDSLKGLYPGQKFIFVCGMMSDKQTEEMLSFASPLGGYMITLAPANNPRAADPETLANTARKYYKNVYAAHSLASALDKALEIQSSTGLPVCCFGTLYMSGEIQKYFAGKGDGQNEKQ